MDLSAMGEFISIHSKPVLSGPSLDNPLLFSLYADEIAVRQGRLYPERAGYRIK